MSRPSVGSSSTSNFASIAMTSARCSCATIPLDNCRTLLVRLIVVFARKFSAFARSNRGCTPATYSSNCVTRIQRGRTATSAMKETSRVSSSRAFQGSRPSTVNFPSYEVSPRIALSAVVLPAPFGPISPRMRPSSTRRSTLSKATVVPKTLRRPCASIVAITSPPLCCLGTPLRGGGIEFFLGQTKPLNLFRNPRPFVGEKFLTFALQQKITRAGFNKHPKTALHLDQLLIDQLLIGLQNGQRIDPKFGCDVADGRQRIAFFEHTVENHMDATIAKLAINRLTIIPFTTHPCVPNGHCVLRHAVAFRRVVVFVTADSVGGSCNVL